MSSQLTARAMARLNQIADLGFTAYSTVSGNKSQILASTHEPAWTSEQVEDWKTSDDPLIMWFEENLDVVPARGALGDKTTSVNIPLESTTFSSDLVVGARVALVLSHTSEVLDQNQINEARAAACVLNAELGTTPESGITQKEVVYLEQVSGGATDDEIAGFLGLSLRAVKERKRKAIEDLNAENIGHAIGIAKRTGLI